MTTTSSSDDLAAARRVRIAGAIRDVPDYPKPGILFRDITPVLADPGLLREVVLGLAEPFRKAGITHVVGIEARGFILGAPVAIELGAGFVPVRKEGKLPWRSRRMAYDLEYGQAVVEAHEDAIPETGRILIVDDVLATGGTAAAAAGLVRDLQGNLAGWSFLLELDALNGRQRLGTGQVESLLRL